MSQEEVTAWERQHMDGIKGWTAEYDVKPGYKVITFNMKDKTTFTFEIEL